MGGSSYPSESDLPRKKGAPADPMSVASSTGTTTTRSQQFRFAMLNDEWMVSDKWQFESPNVPERPEQTLIFSDTFRNGSIQAEIVPLESLGLKWDKEPSIESTILFRYTGSGSYYYAGLGAWGKKFFIGKALFGDTWFHLASAGEAKTIRNGSPYRLRIDCVGNRISLFENDVRVLDVYDEEYQSGQWGLRAWKARARFERLQLDVSPPQCFVVMPFSSDLGFVYKIIRKVVTSYGITCVRADELAVSRPVIDDIREQISGADLLIVDFTGRNPNVYFEAGLADAWKKKWIILAQSTEDLSFDVHHIRTILYSNRMGADVTLEEQLDKAIQETMGLTPKVKAEDA